MKEENKKSVFISYAHIDNLPEKEGEKGWVEQFEYQLTVGLLKRFGETVGVWRDPELARSQLFDKVIEKQVRGSKVMLSLLSNRYLKSDYCQQEIEWFCEQAATEPYGLVVNDHTRVIPIKLYNIQPNLWPKACQGASAFDFFTAEKSNDFGTPLDPASKAFQSVMRRLVEELYSIITYVNEAISEAAPPAPHNAIDGEGSFRIFLAHAPEDLGPTRRQLTKALKKNGIIVETDTPPPWDDSAHKEKVTETLSQVDLAVHLLSSRPGEPINDQNLGHTYPIEQVNLGLQHASSQIILFPEELDYADIEDHSYAGFLDSLIEKNRDSQRLEVIKTGRHQMLDEILEKRMQIERAAKATEANLADQAMTAFIDLHVTDIPNATDLVGYLSHEQITPIMVPSADLSPTKGLTLFEENLKKAQLFILVYGDVTRSWVEHRIQEAFKIILSNRLDTVLGIYVAPPKKTPDLLSFPGLLDVALNMNHFDPETLKPLLDKAGEVT